MTRGPRRRRSDGRRSSPRATRCSPSCSGRACGSSGARATATTTRTPREATRRGRSVEGVPFDARQLGEWHDKLQPSLAKGYGLAVKTNELRSVQYFNRSPQAFATAARVFLRSKAGTLRRQELLTNGASLMGQMLKVMIDLVGAPPVWTNTSMDDLVVEDGRVVGVRATRDGAPVLIEAAQGSAARGRWLRPQRRDATQVQREPAERGAVVDRERGRHRGGARDGDGAGRQDRPARRGVVAPVDRSLARDLITRRGATTAASDLRRLDRSTVLQRVELLCRSGQGDVRAQGGAVLAHLRRGVLPARTRRRQTPSSAGCRRRRSRAARCGERTRWRSWRARSASIPTGWSERCNASTSTR